MGGGIAVVLRATITRIAATARYLGAGLGAVPENWLWLLAGQFAIAGVTFTLFSLEKYLALQQTLDEVGAPATVLALLYTLQWQELLTLPWLWF